MGMDFFTFPWKVRTFSFPWIPHWVVVLGLLLSLCVAPLRADCTCKQETSAISYNLYLKKKWNHFILKEGTQSESSRFLPGRDLVQASCPFPVQPTCAHHAFICTHDSMCSSNRLCILYSDRGPRCLTWGGMCTDGVNISFALLFLASGRKLRLGYLFC